MDLTYTQDSLQKFLRTQKLLAKQNKTKENLERRANPSRLLHSFCSLVARAIE